MFESNENKLEIVQDILNNLAGIGPVANSNIFIEFIENSGTKIWQETTIVNERLSNKNSDEK